MVLFAKKVWESGNLVKWNDLGVERGRYDVAGWVSEGLLKKTQKKVNICPNPDVGG